jgi:predicted nucleic acid-binding protein
MRLVVDTNIAFSGILNTDGRIARIFLQPKSRFNFYSTQQLLNEIEEHKGKIKKIAGYTDQDLNRAIALITSRTRFINASLIPKEVYLKAEALTLKIDIDDTEFVALGEHAKAKLWSGDKALVKGLRKKWDKFITTEELYNLLTIRK